MTAKSQFPDEQSEAGEFTRQEDAFRAWVSDKPGANHPPERGRYHLYVSLACPWASRTLIVRKLKGLDEAVSLTIADPVRTEEEGWAFRDGPGHSRDTVNGFKFLREAYLATDPNFSGRVTVPVLWDKRAKVIVNNSEDDICRMFNGVFGPLGGGGLDLFPEAIEAEHRAMSALLYETINNGVYQAGFASSQKAYEKAARRLFDSLDQIERRLSRQRYLFGNRVVEADWRLFCTLIRFDAVYHGHFKCNLRRVLDYANLDGYLRDLYQQRGVAETVNFDHIKRHYYLTHHEINPNGIVPIGPALDLERPHGRETLGTPNSP